VGITAGSREVPGRKDCDNRPPYNNDVDDDNNNNYYYYIVDKTNTNSFQINLKT